ncbi:MAG TPA: transposase [Kofleriaceae bacterium]|nr:transposase [Kofleriaceae bacterium]
MGKQVEMKFPCTWGGPREGAGRKKKPGAGVSHGVRPWLDGKNVPVHVTLRVVKGVRWLRGFKIYPAVRRALVASSARFGMRIIHFSVQADHIHLLVEARDRRSLSRAMQGFEVRVARRVNALMGRKGRVFVDRYHAHQLESPTEARRALVYVLGNGAKHAGDPRERAASHEVTWIDPMSSACYFRGWARRPGRMPARDAPGHPLHEDEAQRGAVVAEPRTWVLRGGWRRGGGLILPWERPREARG